jgi:transcriptional regulator with XRE-family HTH domain
MRINTLTLIQERAKKGWSQTELAERAGLSKSYMSQIESGYKNPSELVTSHLASILGISVTSLVGRTRCPHCGGEF